MRTGQYLHTYTAPNHKRLNGKTKNKKNKNAKLDMYVYVYVYIFGVRKNSKNG